MSEIVLSKTVTDFKSKLNTMYDQGNLKDKSITMPLPADSSIGVRARFLLADINLLTSAVNILETQFNGNCNCAQNTSKCQSCQTTTCQSSVCQSCQSLSNCNCCGNNDDGSNY